MKPGSRSPDLAGIVHMVPVLLAADGAAADALPPAVVAAIHGLRMFAAENPKSARAFLKAVGHPGPMQAIRIEPLDALTSAEAIDSWLDRVKAGEDLGVVSEAGCPGVADPGALVARRAHARGLRVRPLVGPSSVLLALMASGLEGQRFIFHGYLPAREPARAQALKSVERRSRERRETQIFIETPYRNEALFGALLSACSPATRLCLASDLTAPGETIATRTVSAWRTSPRPILHDHPTVFLLLA